MFIRVRLLALALTLAPALAAAEPAPQPKPAPVQVMIVGDFHMANPGHDLHNQAIDDVLAPKRQAEIKAVTDALARFRPTRVAAEWPADIAADRYAQYLDETLSPSHNEVVQLGFRLAKASGLKAFLGIDADGEFPYDAVQAWAKAHGQQAVLDAEGAKIDAQVKAQARAHEVGGVAGELRYLNNPARLAGDNGFYRTTLKMGAGRDQPGVELMSAWYRRNFLICASLIQAARPGDRIVVFYGAGHAFLLRQCVRETPGFVLVEPNAWLPK